MGKAFTCWVGSEEGEWYWQRRADFLMQMANTSRQVKAISCFDTTGTLGDSMSQSYVLYGQWRWSIDSILPSYRLSSSSMCESNSMETEHLQRQGPRSVRRDTP
jgi:hypothetical protein